jgi:hypothetical protein
MCKAILGVVDRILLQWFADIPKEDVDCIVMTTGITVKKTMNYSADELSPVSY